MFWVATLIGGAIALFSDKVTKEVCELLGIPVAAESDTEEKRAKEIAEIETVPLLATGQDLTKCEAIDIGPYQQILDFKTSFINVALLLLTLGFAIIDPWWWKLLALPCGIITWRRAITPRDDLRKPQTRIDAHGVSGIHDGTLRKFVRWNKIASCEIVTVRDASGQVIDVYPAFKDKKGRSILNAKMPSASLQSKELFMQKLKATLGGETSAIS